LSGFIEEKDRKIVPRWRSFSRTVARGEFDSLRSRSTPARRDEAFEKKLREWEQNPTLPFATEVVAGAVVLGREQEAGDAANFVISMGDNASPSVRRLADLVARPSVSDAEEGEDPIPVRGLRERLSEDPRNSVAWVDLALHFSKVGALRKARRAMDVAVELAPNSRFVLRSAARFFVHVGDPERAWFALLRSQATPIDPWLIASEIAVQAVLGKASDLVKAGRRMLDAGGYGPLHLSELASALGTLEMEASSGRESRRLFRKALLEPTENSVAQVGWALHKMGASELDPAYVEKESFEAHAWTSFYSATWEAALSASRKWLDDQPFSSRPAVLGSYVASVWSQDHLEGVRLARAGLRANPDDPMLVNNLAYSLANLGRLDEAAKVLEQMRNRSRRVEVEVMRLSTGGMIEYRRGRPDAGRALYLQGLEKANGPGLERLLARACSFMAMEEKRANTLYFPKARELAEKLSRGVPDNDLHLLVERLR
jgi:tetratricopeptide (TPR) repeat protein